jgi:hypothetical protein
MLFKDIIPAYTENHMNIVEKAELFVVNVGGTYSYHRVLKS